MRRVRLSLDRLPGGELRIVGFPEANPVIEVPTDGLRSLKMYVKVPAGSLEQLTPPSTGFDVIVTDVDGEDQMTRSVVFQSPKR